MAIYSTIINKEISFVCNSIVALTQNFKERSKDYQYDDIQNEFKHVSDNQIDNKIIVDWGVIDKKEAVFY